MESIVATYFNPKRSRRSLISASRTGVPGGGLADLETLHVVASAYQSLANEDENGILNSI
jgi:hypothetical protein